MPIVRLFNGEEVSGDILEDRDEALVIEHCLEASPTKKVIQKHMILSIDF